MALSKAQIKNIQSLKLKKYRQKYNKFTAEGDKIVTEVLRFRPEWVCAIYGLSTWLEGQAELLADLPVSVTEISVPELKKISQLKTPNQVVAEVKMEPLNWQFPGERIPWVLFLDGLQDPGNLGTILRIADWFGLQAVVMGPGTVDWQNTKVIQASMGAFLRVPIVESSLTDIQALLPGYALYGADMEGQTLGSFRFPERGVLVIGNEGQGISGEVKSRIEQYVTIPRHAASATESLNAAVATGILVAFLTGQE